MTVSSHSPRIVVNFIFVTFVYQSVSSSEATGSRLNFSVISGSRLMVLQFSNLSCAHAESPVWDERTQTLYWVDAANNQIHALDYPSLAHRTKYIGYGEVNVVVPVVNSSRLLVSVRSELYLMDWGAPGDSALRLVAAVDVGRPDNLLNEGKADRTGRFWVGSKGSQVGDIVAPDEATLYSLQAPDFTPRVQLRPVTISNGLVWALNNSVFYYIDSATRKIQAFDFDLRKGHISNRRTILDVKKRGFMDTIPDGMTIDKEGMLWVALMFNGSEKNGYDWSDFTGGVTLRAIWTTWSCSRLFTCPSVPPETSFILFVLVIVNGSVIRVNPDTKEILELYKLPVSRVTSVAWMGENMDNLVITTSRRNLDRQALEAQPMAGALFILRNCTTSGYPDHKFYFPNADEY